MSVPTMPGITVQAITSSRLSTRVLFCGPEDGMPVLFIHGNLSSATYWEETMLALPPGYRAIAYDQRGYGDAEAGKWIDATRGMGDLADDAIALLDTLNLDKVHLVGHSMGGSVVWRLLIDAPQRFLTATVAAPGSPYGYGACHGLDAEANWPDYAGSGGGIINPQLPPRIAAGDRGIENSQSSPRIVMNKFYWKPSFRPAREEDLLSSMLSTHISDKHYPGDFVPSQNWPGVAPGAWGVNNALSPKYAGDVSRLWKADPKPPILWIRGADDQIISDTSLFDLVTLGMMGAVPGFPGTDNLQQQPMVSQTRAVLEKYKAAGGDYQEVAFEDCAHTPYLEKFDEFNALLHKHIG